MGSNPDFKDLLRCFNRAGVRYLAAGSYALAYLLMALDGVEFESAWPNRVESTYGGEAIAYVGRDDLVRSKQASGRPQDLLDLEMLVNMRLRRP